jgi:Spy/CpxP family protein refolding chaperone
MRKGIAVLISCALICLFALTAGAGQFGADDPGRQQRFEQLRERIEKLKAERMQKALALDERTAAQVSDISRRYDQRRFELRKNSRNDMQTLRQSLRGKNDAEMQSALERVEQRQQTMQALKADERAEIRRILTPEQMAKYTLFQEAFAQEMREKIRNIKQRRGEPSLR